jgi:O-antigen/teichoic acid export membrane protein
MRKLRGIGREFIFFSGSTVTLQASRFLVAMLVARWVGPLQFGIWNALQPVLDYSKVFFCGIPNAMNREVPVLMGRGQKKEAEKVINFTFWFLLIISSILGIIFGIISFFSNIAEGYKTPLLCLGLLFMASNIYLYYEFLLKSRIQFSKMSLQQLIYAFSYPIITLIFSYYKGLSGFILGQSIAAALISYVIYRIFPIPIRKFIPWQLFPKLAKIGIPLMSVGLLYNLLITVDRWIILGHIGIKALGEFTLPILVFSTISRIPRIISEQIYPRMAYRYGETGSKKELIPYILQHSLLALALTVPLILVAYLILPKFVSLVMPQYSNGIQAARIILISLLFLPLISGIGNFLNVIDKQIYYLLVQVVAVIINVGLGIWFVKLGWGIVGVAWADVVTYFCYSLLVSVVGIVIFKENKSAKAEKKIT